MILIFQLIPLMLYVRALIETFPFAVSMEFAFSITQGWQVFSFTSYMTLANIDRSQHTSLLRRHVMVTTALIPERRSIGSHCGWLWMIIGSNHSTHLSVGRNIWRMIKYTLVSVTQSSITTLCPVFQPRWLHCIMYTRIVLLNVPMPCTNSQIRNTIKIIKLPPS